MMAVTWKTGTPPKEGQYLATVAELYVTTLKWCDGWNCHKETDGSVNREHEFHDVTAWTELPEPYKKPKRAIDGEELKRWLREKGGLFDFILIEDVMNRIECLPDYREEET